MNLINIANVTTKDLSLTKTRLDSKFDQFILGYSFTPQHTINNISHSFLFKSFSQPFDSFKETSLNFNNYSDSQKILLLNLFNNNINISYAINTSELKTINGVVTKNDTPSPYAEVILHDKISGCIIKRTRSDSFGNFKFSDILPMRSWYIVAFDQKGDMNAVIISDVIT